MNKTKLRIEVVPCILWEKDRYHWQICGKTLPICKSADAYGSPDSARKAARRFVAKVKAGEVG